MKRTNYVGRTSEKQIGQEVVLKGWVASRRSFGGLIFIDLRDREGIVQLVFDEEKYPEAFKVANEVRNEYIIEIRGVVRKRAEANPDMKTGTIEVEVEEANQLATSMTPPFSVKDDTEANEEMRLKYRFIDLRRPKMMNYLKLRSKMTSVVHRYFDSHDFLDVETPDLTRSTPEGARDFLVPSRMYPGHFYALPQSPQLFKQLLMASGVDRYYQMARCFRDEDLRGDRQPEFTQIDMEMSFASAEEIQSTTEGLIKMMMKEIKGIDIKTPFPRMKWQYAMDKYGTDKPDTRFEMLIEDLTDLFKNSSFKLFANEANQEHHFVRAICVQQGAEKYSRKDLEEKEDYIKRYQAKGLAWVKVGANGYTGTIADQISDQAAEINKRLGANEGDLILFVAGSFQVVCDSLGWLRREIGHEMHMMNDEQWNYMWLVDWPMFEYDEGWGRWIAAHHPFTMLNPEDLHYLNDGEDPHKAHAQSYDIILNGQEIGGGSIRVHNPKIQEKIFKALGYSKEEANTRFGFLIKGLEYGMPPEGGLAFGFDRWVLMLAHANSIRDVVPFPKNSKGIEPMTAAPGTVSQGQLDELHIAVNKNTGHVNPKD